MKEVYCFVLLKFVELSYGYAKEGHRWRVKECS